jgi:hypothetical protein
LLKKHMPQLSFNSMKASITLALLCVLAGPGASDAFFFKKWLSALSSRQKAKHSPQLEVKSLTAAKPSSDVAPPVPRKLLGRSEWKRLMDESSEILQSLPNLRDQQQHAKVCQCEMLDVVAACFIEQKLIYRCLIPVTGSRAAEELVG